MTVADIMTKRVISVLKDEPMILAAELMGHHFFNGLPVVDRDNRLVGIITEYDLIAKGSQLHIPTFLKIVRDMPLYKKDSAQIKESLKSILDMKVEEAMNNDPLAVRPEMPVAELAQVFAEHHKVNPIPVVDQDRRVVGLVSRSDLLYIYTGGPQKGLASALRKNLFTLGGPSRLDRKTQELLNNLEERFVVVSKFRSRFWLVASVLFVIVGFVAALAILARFEISF